MYHGIILCGSRNDNAGRNIAGYRLRTAAEKYNYNNLVIDCATAMTEAELELLLGNVITDKTLFLGISTVWLDQPNKINSYGKIQWINIEFFQRIRAKYPKLKIVAGGNGVLNMPGARAIYDSADWHISGFSDDSFPRFLMLLEGKSGHGLKYFIDHNGKKTVDSNKFHLVGNPNDIETVFKSEDNFYSYQPIPLEVSRGCIFRCAFCNHPFQGAKDYDSYMRTPASIAQELRRNYDLFGITRYSIMDDTFNDSIEKLNRLEQAIELAKLPKFEFQCYIKPELLVTKPEMIPQLLRMGLTGGFVGIESMNNVARRAMNKGMNIERVVGALTELTSSNQAKLRAGFIIGLPTDTIDSVYETNEFCKANQQVFKGWTFTPLRIYSYSEVEKESALISPLERDPEKYGYKITKYSGEPAVWENDYMTMNEAIVASEKLTIDSEKVMRCGGWQISSAWHNNISDMDIESKTIVELKLGMRGRQMVRDRAIETLQKYT